MAVTITVPPEYGYVLITAASTFFLGFWHGGRVPAFRKAAGFGHPKQYADSAELAAASPEKKQAMYLFNCAQRAHGNYLENQPSLAIALLIAGLQFPITSTGMGVAWMVSRVVYAIGYTSKNQTGGRGRYIGLWFSVPQIALSAMVVYMGVKMVI